MKVFISADIEGTNGIAHWDETSADKRDYKYFADKMTQEVNAVCTGVNKAAPDCEIYVKDAHDSGRNLDHHKLPKNTRLNRNYAHCPYSMLDGIDETFAASIFTGYHSQASSNGNPLSHTMSRQFVYIKINGVAVSEFVINYYSSLYNGVPVVMVSGDEALCRRVKEVDANIYTVSAVTGRHGSTTSKHPEVTNAELTETAQEAIKNRSKMSMELPKGFKTELYFKTHYTANMLSYYPGAYMTSDHSVGYDTCDYFEFLKFLMFSKYYMRKFNLKRRSRNHYNLSSPKSTLKQAFASGIIDER